MRLIKPIDKKEQARFFKLLRKYKKYLFSFPGVTDMAIGFPFRRKKMQKEICIIVHVSKKLSDKKLNKKHILPKKIEGVRVDVIETHPVKHADENPIEPLLGGISISTVNLKLQGTLGAIVFDNDTSEPMGLTNHHVIIKKLFFKAGDAVTQPALKPDAPQFTIGNVLRGNFNIDAAVFKINGSRVIDSNNSLNGIQGKIKGVTDPVIGMPVKKSGATSSVTYGIISQIGFDKIAIHPNKQKAPSQNNLSLPGDSGSIWVTDTDDMLAVGLHTGGEIPGSGFEYAYASYIKKVLTKLNVHFS